MTNRNNGGFEQTEGEHESHAPPQFTIPKTTLDVLGICDKNMFSTIKMLVHMLVTLLISETTNNKQVPILFKICDGPFFFENLVRKRYDSEKQKKMVIKISMTYK